MFNALEEHAEAVLTSTTRGIATCESDYATTGSRFAPCTWHRGLQAH